MTRCIGNTILGGACAAALLILSGCSGRLESVLPLEPEHAALSGQASDPSEDGSGIAAESATGRLFFPLDLGNHWEYERVFRFQIDPDQGPPGPLQAFPSTVEVDLVGNESRFGREYVVWLETYRDGSQEFSYRFLYRQDRGGLYNADPEPTDVTRLALEYYGVARAGSGPHRFAESGVGSSPRHVVAQLAEKHAMIRNILSGPGAPVASQARGGRPAPQPGEIALLRYPLHAHRSWHVREDPLVVFTVEGMESLELPAGRFNGWRIRIDWPGVFGPNDRAHVWYGRQGLLKLEAHLEGIATDEGGEPYGTIRSEELEVLSDLTLVKRSGGRGHLEE